MTGRPGRVAIVEQLRADGVRHVFGNPGTVEQGLLDALGDAEDIQYVLALQEAVAVGIADGYARATRRPTVVQLHSGVGLGNGIGMMYQAMRGHAPLVVLAGNAGLRYSAMDAQMAADLVGMARPVTKWATQVVDPDSVLRVLRRAMKVAATPPMGPVFLELPMDVLDAVTTEEAVPTAIPVTRVAPAAGEVRAAAQLLAGARRPMIIAGDGVAASGAQPELARVAELLGAEVWGADWSEVNLAADHPQFRGLLGHMFGAHSSEVTRTADAVLVVGTYVFPEVFPNLAGVFDPAARVVHVDLDAWEIGKNFPVDLGLVADPKETLAALATALEGGLDPADRVAAAERADRLGRQQRAERAAAVERDRSFADQVPLHASGFAQELAGLLPADAVLFDEALTTSPELFRYLPASRPGSYFQTRGGSLGVGFPGAVGLKIAHPDRTVVGFSGDGGSMYTPQALWTAARHDVAAKFVVCNNSSYELLKLNIEEYWTERDVAGRPFPRSFDLRRPEIDFARLAESLGVPAVRVEKPGQVGPAVREALLHPGPFLVDLVIANQVPDVRSVAAAAKA